MRRAHAAPENRLALAAEKTRNATADQEGRSLNAAKNHKSSRNRSYKKI